MVIGLKEKTWVDGALEGLNTGPELKTAEYFLAIAISLIVVADVGSCVRHGYICFARLTWLSRGTHVVNPFIRTSSTGDTLSCISVSILYRHGAGGVGNLQTSIHPR